MKIFVIPATFNEADNIEKFITILEEEVFPKIKNHEMHVLVADDFSPDGTGEIVKKMMSKYKNLGINQGERKGLGAAYIRTMSEAIDKLGADVVVSIDADFQFDPHDLPKFIEKIDEGYDMVIQTRYSGGGSIPENWPPQRKLFSIVANIFVRTVFMRFSIHDWTGGFRAIKKEVFQKVKSEMYDFRGYIFQIAFLHKTAAEGFKIAEIPLHFSDRTLGNSKIAPLPYILDVIKYVMVARILELKRVIKFLIVGGTGFLVQISTQEFFARIVFANLLNKSFRDGLSAGFGAEGAIISNFMFNNFWTFKDTKKIKENSTFFNRMVKFNIASFMSIAIQSTSVYIFVHLLGENIYILDFTIKTRLAILVPTIVFLVVPLNYLIYNRIIWKTQYLKNEPANK